MKEIDLEGNVQFLDELITRSKIADEMQQVRSDVAVRYASLCESFVLEESINQRLQSLMSSDDVETLVSFLKTPISESTPHCSLQSAQLNGDKENRKAFHGLIRESFGDILTTDTLEVGNVRSILVWIKKFQEQEQVRFKQESRNMQNGNKRMRVDNRNTAGVSVGVMMKNPWPANRPDHLHFRLYKENRDTAEAIQSISRCLGIPPKSFSFCGTKDRRGITVQSVSVYRISIEDMKKALLHSSWDMAVRISHMEYKDYPLKIGRLNGNRFKICLRAIASDSGNDEIEFLFKQLGEKGFINYFGLQRFGTRSVRTHELGKFLFAQDWKGAVDALLSPEADNMLNNTNASNGASRTEWRKEYAKGDVSKALELCPPFLYIERSLLRALDKSGQSTNYLGAIQSLPSSNVNMYLHAVQSFAFNAALSERIRTYGLSVQVGDLVQAGESSVVIVESAEQASKHSIYDVVMTLVGSSVVIPPIMDSFYTIFFQESLGIPIEDLTGTSERKLPSIIQLKGAYRKIVQRATNLNWKIFDNVSDSDVLIQSDVDVLKGNELVTRQNPPSGYKAVVFECDLEAGAYLTMALRELSDTHESSPTIVTEETEPES